MTLEFGSWTLFGCTIPPMHLDFAGPQLAALIIATSFAAGLNTYATVATLGILARTGVLSLPGSLHPIANSWIIGACIALFCVELFADKIPAFDLVWNALHTFVRIPVAAALAYAATSNLSPQMQLFSALAGAGVAFAAHGGKTAARAIITPSPEPVSNIAFSTAEDALAIFLTWFASKHPYVSAGIALVLTAVVVLLIRWVIRALKRLFRGAEHAVAPAES